MSKDRKCEWITIHYPMHRCGRKATHIDIQRDNPLCEIHSEYYQRMFDGFGLSAMVKPLHATSNLSNARRKP